jgi:hypothetical protein
MESKGCEKMAPFVSAKSALASGFRNVPEIWAVVLRVPASGICRWPASARIFERSAFLTVTAAAMAEAGFSFQSRRRRWRTG